MRTQKMMVKNSSSAPSGDKILCQENAKAVCQQIDKRLDLSALL
jgi:hypothetical protein